MSNKFESEDFSFLLSNHGEAFLKYLFDRYYDELCRLAFRYSGRSDIAEDVVQNVFINIWNKRLDLSCSGAIKPYLLRSVINASLNNLKNKHERQSFDVEETLVTIEAATGYQDDIAEKELVTLLEIAIAQLPEKCREIFAMSRLSGLSHKEIAKQLDISTKTIEAQITIALKKIKHFLEKMGYFGLWFLLLM